MTVPRTTAGPSDGAPTTSAPREAGVTQLLLVLGLATGFALLAALGVARFVLGRYLHTTPHAVWMLPLANAVLFGALALALQVIGFAWRRARSLPMAATTGVFLAGLSVTALAANLAPWAAVLLSAGVAAQAGRIASRHAALVRSATRRLLVPLAAAVALSAAGMTGWFRLAERRALASLPESGAGAPNVLLLVLDTVRAASLSLYGHAVRTSPSLEALAAKGARFDAAISPAPWTLPSHASLMTGRWPHELSADWTTPLDDVPATLAETLSGRGYATAGFAANSYYCGLDSGLARGFAHYEAGAPGWWQVLRTTRLGLRLANATWLRHAAGQYSRFGRWNAPEVSASLLRWIDRNPDRPFFAFVNYFDAHSAYDPPPPYDSVLARAAPRSLFDLTPGSPWTPEQVAAEQVAYEAAITFLDRQLGELFEQLRVRGKLDNTIIVVTSDHGEEFMEHGVMEHGHSLYRPALHVPLVIRFPARVPPGTVVPAPVSLRDVAATILQMATPAMPPALPGESLSRFWTGEPPAGPPAVLASVNHARGLPERYPVSSAPLRSVVTPAFQYIRDSRGKEELFDWLSDPAQQRNLAAVAERRGDLDRMRQLLDSLAGRDSR